MKKATGLVVEAACVGENDINELANWAHAYVIEEKDAITGDILEALNVRTKDGTERACNGMYVIKVDGQMSVSQPGVFHEKYVPHGEPDLPKEVPPEFFKFNEGQGPRQI
jgi:hypothetical protein